MMKWIYSLGLFGYKLGINFSSLWNPKARMWVQGRVDVFSKLAKALEETSSNRVWFHCASLGEFEQGRPIMEEMLEEDPSIQLVVTFFSPSGYEYRKDYKKAIVIYLPIDSKSNAKRLLNIISPRKVFFVKYEFWYYYLTEVRKRGIPLFLVGGIFRANQLFFSKKFGGFHREMLDNFSWFFLQNMRSAELLAKVGIKNYSVVGDPRIDNVIENTHKVVSLPIIEEFVRGEQLVVVLGSSWPKEEAIVAEAINNLSIKLIIAPHDIGPGHLDEIEKVFDQKMLRYSKIDHESEIKGINTLLIDSIGILSSVYKYADVAFVGGGYTGALHNILEPASWGNAVLFGPKHQKFPEAQQLLNSGGAREINNVADLLEFLTKCRAEQDFLLQIKASSKSFVMKQQGVTKKIVKKIDLR